MLIAVILGAPISYFFMKHWLQNFAYRIDIGPGVFLLAGTLALLVPGPNAQAQTQAWPGVAPINSTRYWRSVALSSTMATFVIELELCSVPDTCCANIASCE